MNWRVDVIFDDEIFESSSALKDTNTITKRLNCQEAIDYFQALGVTMNKRTLYRLSESGKLKSLKLSERRTFWTQLDINKYLTKHDMLVQ